jgi:hypothetical protein
MLKIILAQYQSCVILFILTHYYNLLNILMEMMTNYDGLDCETVLLQRMARFAFDFWPYAQSGPTQE